MEAQFGRGRHTDKIGDLEDKVANLEDKVDDLENKLNEIIQLISKIKVDVGISKVKVDVGISKVKIDVEIITISNYKKSLLVTGPTKDHKEFFKEFGLKWNGTLSGWVLSPKKEEEFITELGAKNIEFKRITETTEPI